MTLAFNLTRPGKRWSSMARCGHTWPNEKVRVDPDHVDHHCHRPIGHLGRAVAYKSKYHQCACGASTKLKVR